MPKAKKVIYYVPVEEKYLSRWEYYQVDYDVLSELYDEVVVCSSLRKVIQSMKGADLVYCWWWHQSTPIVLFAKLFGIKTQVTGAVHMFDLSGAPDFYKKSFLFRLSAKLCFYLADSNLFISRDQYLQITSHCTVNNPAVLLSSLSKRSDFDPNSVRNKRHETLMHSSREERLNFFSISWHTSDQYRRKGVFETLEALSIFKKNTNASFKWIVAGGYGDGIEELKSRIDSFDLADEVEVLVDITPEQKKDLFYLSDLYIQPSWCEGFGNAVLEAMSHGLPALTSRYTAQPEVVGNSGFIAMEMSPDAIAEQLVNFSSLSLSDKSLLEEKVLQRVNDHFHFDCRLAALKKLNF